MATLSLAFRIGGNPWHCTYICNPPISLYPIIILSQYTAMLVLYKFSRKNIFVNLLNVANAIKLRCTLNFLLLVTLTMIDKFLSGYRRKGRDIEAGSSKHIEVSSSR
jgi:hypothetical protein